MNTKSNTKIFLFLLLLLSFLAVQQTQALISMLAPKVQRMLLSQRHHRLLDNGEDDDDHNSNAGATPSNYEGEGGSISQHDDIKNTFVPTNNVGGGGATNQRKRKDEFDYFTYRREITDMVYERSMERLSQRRSF